MHAPSIRVVKYHALGNDYLVLEGAETPAPELVRHLCDRHRGVGGDGVLFPATNPGIGAPFGLRIFNPDGGEAERSGNGLRIFAQYLLDEGHATDSNCLIRIPAGDVQARFLEGAIEVEMGLPDFRAGALPFLELPPEQEVISHPLALGAEHLFIHALSLGNPHVIILLPEGVHPQDQESLVRQWGPLLERDPRFPHGVNVEVVQRLGSDRLRTQIWERGAGYTLASGSGATASAAAARRQGLVGDHVEVLMPGGVLNISFDAAGRALLRGPVQRVFTASLDARWLQQTHSPETGGNHERF